MEKHCLIALDMEGIFVSTGSACSSGSVCLHKFFQQCDLPQSMISSSLRFSLGWSNTFEDINFTVKTLANAVMLSRQKPVIVL